MFLTKYDYDEKQHTERWAGHVTQFEEVRNAGHVFILQNLKTVCHLR
jgi:hypothetical protein